MLDLIKRHLAALSATNWDEYKASLAPDAVYEEHASMQRAKGADAYLKVIQAWKRGFPDLEAHFLDGFASGNKVFAEVEWEGTHTGPFKGPFGELAPTNKRGTVKAALIFTITDGKISECHHYFDILTILRQMGVAPMATPPGPAAKAAPPARPKH